MKKCIVIYGSYYGSTKSYAEHIAAICNAECISFKELKDTSLAAYDTIVFGGGLYAGGLHGSKVLKERQAELLDKRLIVFTVGASDPKDKKDMDHIEEEMKKFFGEEWYSKLSVYHLRGNLLYSKMGLKHRTMMKMLVTMLKKKPEHKEDELVKTYGQDVIFVDLSTAKDIIETIQQEEGSKDESSQTGECRCIS